MKHTVYTTALHSTLVTALRAGSTYRDACEVSGIAWGTWRWWRSGGSTDPRVVELVREAQEAHGIATQSLIASVKVAAQKDWKAAMSLVEFRAGTRRRNAEASRAYWQARLAKKLCLAAEQGLVEGRPVVQLVAELMDLRLAEPPPPPPA